MNSQRGQAVLISLRDKRNASQGDLVRAFPCGALAQLGERLICIQEVIGSIPIGSTITLGRRFDCKAHDVRFTVQLDGIDIV